MKTTGGLDEHKDGGWRPNKFREIGMFPNEYLSQLFPLLTPPDRPCCADNRYCFSLHQPLFPIGSIVDEKGHATVLKIFLYLKVILGVAKTTPFKPGKRA